MKDLTLTDIVDKIRALSPPHGLHELTDDQAAQLIQSYCDKNNKRLRAIAEKVVEALKMRSPFEFAQAIEALSDYLKENK